MSKSPRTGVKSASQDVCPQGTPSRAHPWIGLNLVGRIQRHSGWVYSVAISPDASRIASCSNDRTVRIIQASHVASDSDASGGIVLNGHSHAVRCCAFNSSGSLLATASWDGDVRVWDVVSGSCQRVISPAASGNRVYACAWAVSGTDASEILATAGGGGGTCPVDFALRIWKLVGDEEASCRVLGGHTKAVTCLAFAADGIRLASSSDDHTLRVWDVASGSCSLVMSHENAVCCCCWAPGVPSSSSSNDSCCRTIASGDQDSFVIVWNADTGARLFRIGSCQTAVLCLMYISFGTMLASGGRDGSIKIWDATTGAGLSEVISAHSDSVRGMACDSSGQLLVTASADMSVKVWKQGDRPPPLPPRSAALLLRRKADKVDDESLDDDSDSASVTDMFANHGMFTAQSKRSLASSFDTPTDAEDDTQLVPHAVDDCAGSAVSGALGILSPITSKPIGNSPSSVSKRQGANGSSSRERLSANNTNWKQQSPSPVCRVKAARTPSQQMRASFDSSFADSPTDPPGAAATVAMSMAAVAGGAVAVSVTESSSMLASSSSSEGHRTCVGCGENWICESREREHFSAKGFCAPRRCGKCRRQQKLELLSSGASCSCSSSGVLKDDGIASKTDATELQNAGAPCTHQHQVYRGTNLHGIGFVYEGGVNSSCRQEGFGTQIWDTNHSYKGEWLRGRKEGRGVYTWPDGSTYEGEYKNGRRHGLGLQTMSDGAVYDGSFKNGEWDGAGRHTWPEKFVLANGQVVRGYMNYAGEYRAGLMHGHGQMCWPDGSIYDGEWHEGAKHGRGELMFPNGRRQHGIWRDDVLTQVLVHVVNGKVLPVVTPILTIRK